MSFASPAFPYVYAFISRSHFTDDHAAFHIQRETNELAHVSPNVSKRAYLLQLHQIPFLVLTAPQGDGTIFTK